MRFVFYQILQLFNLHVSLSTVFALNSDGMVLLSLLRHWTSVPPNVSSSWNISDSTPCQWVGIKCDSNNNVVTLNLPSHAISGHLGPEIVHLRQLQAINLSVNNFSGNIPQQLGNCRNLTLIDFSNNKLSGSIPKELGNLENLGKLNLSYNHLEGSLPFQLGNCIKLQAFDVAFNLLNGTVPSSLTSWKSLSTLNLRENRFTGGIPTFLSELENLKELQIGGNQLGGEMPSSIGLLHSLQYVLNISKNGLTGQIPSELGKLIYLEQLDISSNNLTGTLAPIGNIQSLVEVNVSYNLLTGPVPKSLIKLVDSSPSSFLGNPSLCVSCLSSSSSTCARNSYLKPCDHHSSTGSSLSNFEIILIALGEILFLVFVLLGMVCFFLCLRRPKQDVAISAEEDPEEGPYSLLNKVKGATENLNDRYIIGKGAHGIVYKVTLDPNRVFAVKKLSLGEHNAVSSSIKREIQILGKIRHRNLVRLESCWLWKDYGLILYRYMKNGSLHDVLHAINPPPTLVWQVRYKIAVGTAHGLAYLHYDCDPAILHGDIKPANILLDSDMEPHISDFGIAKLLDPTPASTSSISVLENGFMTANGKESDVYSYGVVLLELITRKKVLDPAFAENTDIVGWFSSEWSNTEDISHIVDLSLVDECQDSNIGKQVIDVLRLALRCTEKKPSNRPTMRDVVNQLSKSNACTRSNYS